MNECLFCNIANGKFDSATIFENSEFRVILDKFPSGKGHTLVMPKKHYDNILEMDEQSVAKMFVIASKMAKVIKKILKCDGINILQNNGEAAGQTVNHVHVHIIPRFENDNVNIKWKTTTFADDEFEKLAKELEKAMN